MLDSLPRTSSSATVDPMPRKLEVSVPTVVRRHGVSIVVRRRVAVPGGFNDYPIEHAQSVAIGDELMFGFERDSRTFGLYVNGARVWRDSGNASTAEDLD